MIDMPRRFAAIASAVSQMAGGPYHAGKVHTVSDPVYDDGGSIIDPGIQVERDCMVQVDSVTEAMRAEAGFTEKDVRLLIIDLSGPIDTDAVVEVLPGPMVPDDLVGSYSVQSVGRDPFVVYRECRGRRV